MRLASLVRRVWAKERRRSRRGELKGARVRLEDQELYARTMNGR